MERDICFIENSNDINLISKLHLSNILFVPLNLETFLYCKENNYEIFDFKKNISLEFHNNSLNVSKDFIDNLNFNLKINYSLKSEIKFFLRFRLNSVLLIQEIVEKIQNENHINSIIVSGLKKNFHRNIDDGNIVTEIVEYLFKDKIYIKKLNSSSPKDTLPSLEGFTPIYKTIFSEQNVLINSVGYNFKKIVNFFKNNNIKVWIPFFENLNFFKKCLYIYRGYQPIEFKKDGNKKNIKNYIQKILFKHKNIDISELLNNFYFKLNFYFNEVDQKSIALKKIVNENKFSLTISNIVKGVNGSILDNDIKCNSICISHGIIAQSFNNFDDKYKKIIAEAVFNGESKFFAIQSRTMLDSLKTHNINGKAIQTGNIVFSSVKRNILSDYILQASTLKDFSNLQFLGVEMFYEYWNMLSVLDEIAKKNFLNITIKPHPTIKNCTSKLKKNFKSLKFSNKSIDLLLSKSSSLISYSSSTIEDALNSKVPVILFDTKKGYKHISSEKPQIDNSAVYYINKQEELELLLKKISNMQEINFENYIFKQDFEKNFKEKILPILNS